MVERMQAVQCEENTTNCFLENRCNFDRILAERPTFQKYLPNEYQEDVLARDEEDNLGETAQQCGKKPKQKGKLASR
ncbi:unnamed protein product [Anisakis simplex]|uniref:Uncharacterized protein n=1 Tax=Anisakis simplex TaxID=6269 RepID=A0A0M3KB15_ANISI|nr:unnamed protein product [Anisakis simplex]